MSSQRHRPGPGTEQAPNKYPGNDWMIPQAAWQYQIGFVRERKEGTKLQALDDCNCIFKFTPRKKYTNMFILLFCNSELVILPFITLVPFMIKILHHT
jgi:hypothetical protein